MREEGTAKGSARKNTREVFFLMLILVLKVFLMLILVLKVVDAYCKFFFDSPV